MLQLNVISMAFWKKGDIVNDFGDIRDGNEWKGGRFMFKRVISNFLTWRKCLSHELPVIHPRSDSAHILLYVCYTENLKFWGVSEL
jgi:hypothetical protein